MDQIYCIWDTVAGARVGALVVARSDAGVIRMFHDGLARHELFKDHPGDYNLLQIASIDDACAVSGLAIPRVVATGAAFVAAQSPTLVAEAN